MCRSKNKRRIKYKKEIIDKICYTELAYGRINKKLSPNLTNDKIEEFISIIISETDENNFIKKSKNIYIKSNIRNVRLTINRIIQLKNEKTKKPFRNVIKRIMATFSNYSDRA